MSNALGWQRALNSSRAIKHYNSLCRRNIKLRAENLFGCIAHMAARGARRYGALRHQQVRTRDDQVQRGGVIFII
jgi:hypothetical protein